MQALLPKIAVSLSRDIPSIYTAGRYLDLEITLADGAVVRTRCERPRGSWGSPKITTEEHLGKARDCLATHLAPEAVAECLAACGAFETLRPAEMRRLLHLASTGAAPLCCCWTTRPSPPC